MIVEENLQSCSTHVTNDAILSCIILRQLLIQKCATLDRTAAPRHAANITLIDFRGATL